MARTTLAASTASHLTRSALDSKVEVLIELPSLIRATRSETALAPPAAGPLTLVVASPGLSITGIGARNARLPAQEMTVSAFGRYWLAGETYIHDLLCRTRLPTPWRSRPGRRRQPGAPFKGADQHLQHALTLLASGGQVAPKSQEGARAFHGAPAA
jgi:hypothetical protein